MPVSTMWLQTGTDQSILGKPRYKLSRKVTNSYSSFGLYWSRLERKVGHKRPIPTYFGPLYLFLHLYLYLLYVESGKEQGFFRHFCSFCSFCSSFEQNPLPARVPTEGRSPVSLLERLKLDRPSPSACKVVIGRQRGAQQR